MDNEHMRCRETTIVDAPSGLKIVVVIGAHQNHLHIERVGEPPYIDNRDFWFTKDGVFDGTGSELPAGRGQEEIDRA